MRSSYKLAIKVSFILLVLLLALAISFYFILNGASRNNLASLDAISKYASRLEEFPPSDEQSWLDPHYENFYKKREYGIIQSIQKLVQLRPINSFGPKYMADLLNKARKHNEKLGLSPDRKHFVHIKANKNTKIFVFGDVHGAFHSLIRDLNKLKKMNIIDNNLSITNKDHFIIFNGDAIDRSPYNIDTLNIYGRLKNQNPKNVFYVRGRHELNKHWYDYSLKRELIIRGAYYSQQKIPFNKEITSFFSNLPEAIYISDKKNNNKALRIAFFKKFELGYPEQQLSPDFLKQKTTVKVHRFKEKNKNQQLDVVAAITTENWRLSNRVKNGLGLLDQDYGATTWAVLSSPTAVHKKFLKFHYDAFVQVSFAQSLKHATINVIHRDIRKDDGFNERKKKYLLTASLSKPPSKVKKIKIGSSLALVRGVPAMGKKAQLGINLAINDFNRNSLNKHIRLYIKNDDYVPFLARENIKDFLNLNIHFVLLPTGTPTIMSYIDVLKNNPLGVFFPITGTSKIRKAKFKNIINLRASYEDEVKILINVLRKNYNAANFAFFYQDDDFGRGPFMAAKKELLKLGIKKVTGIPYTRGNVSFSTHVKKINDVQPDALGFFSTADAAKELIRQMNISHMADTYLFALSFVADFGMRNYVKRLGLKFLFPSPVPNPQKSSTKIAQLYRKAMVKTKLPYDVFSFEAFLASKILLHAINSVPLEDINNQSVMNYIETIKDTNFLGVDIKFNPKNRSLAKYIWIDGSNGDFTWKKYPIE